MKKIVTASNGPLIIPLQDYNCHWPKVIRKIHLVYLLVRKRYSIFRRSSRNHDWMKGKEDMEVAPWCGSSLVFMQRSGRAFTANMGSSPFNIHNQRGQPFEIYNSVNSHCDWFRDFFVLWSMLSIYLHTYIIFTKSGIVYTLVCISLFSFNNISWTSFHINIWKWFPSF